MKAKAIDWERFDPMLRADIPPAEVADLADCTRETVYRHIRTLGISARGYRRKTQNKDFTPDGRFDYLGWLNREKARLGGAEALIQKYGYRERGII